MIITTKASTVRAAARRAGQLGNVTIRTGEAARKAENTFANSDECSVRVAVESPGVQEWLDTAAERYGER